MAFYVYDIDGDPGEVELISSTTAAIGFTATTYEPITGVYAGMQAKKMLVRTEVAPINFTLNGTTPTTAATTNKGMTMNTGEAMIITGINAIRKFKCINYTASSGATVKGIPFF